MAAWWETTALAALGRSEGISISAARQGIGYMALKSKVPYFSDFNTGVYKGDCDAFLKKLFESDPGLAPFRLPVDPDPDYGNEYNYIGDDKYLFVFDRRDDKSFDVEAVSLDKGWVQKINEICKVLERRSAEGRIYVMVQTRQGIVFNSLGVAAVKLERDNYLPSSVDDYDHIVNDLNSVSPCGRIVVMNGTPGTGKTFMVRALLDSCPNATFVLLQSHMVPQLADPALVPSIMNLKRNRPEGPIVFVVEDADSVLATRGSDNIAAISSILNMGDGIFGSLLDIRIIATTNAKVEDLDEAIVRPGRLCKRLDLDELPASQAMIIYKRLTTKELKCSKSDKFTLAEVYRLARQDGWKPTQEKKKLGFVPGGCDNVYPDDAY